MTLLSLPVTVYLCLINRLMTLLSLPGTVYLCFINRLMTLLSQPGTVYICFINRLMTLLSLPGTVYLCFINRWMTLLYLHGAVVHGREPENVSVWDSWKRNVERAQRERLRVALAVTESGAVTPALSGDTQINLATIRILRNPDAYHPHTPMHPRASSTHTPVHSPASSTPTPKHPPAHLLMYITNVVPLMIARKEMCMKAFIN